MRNVRIRRNVADATDFKKKASATFETGDIVYRINEAFALPVFYRVTAVNLAEEPEEPPTYDVRSEVTGTKVSAVTQKVLAPVTLKYLNMVGDRYKGIITAVEYATESLVSTLSDKEYLEQADEDEGDTAEDEEDDDEEEGVRVHRRPRVSDDGEYEEAVDQYGRPYWRRVS